MTDQIRGMNGAMAADAHRSRDFDRHADEAIRLANPGRYAAPHDPADETRAPWRPQHAKPPMTLKDVTDLTMERIRRLGRRAP